MLEAGARQGRAFGAQCQRAAVYIDAELLDCPCTLQDKFQVQDSFAKTKEGSRMPRADARGQACVRVEVYMCAEEDVLAR